MSSWPLALMLIWRKTSSMHLGASTLERGTTGTTMTRIRIRNNQWSPECCSILCVVQFPALCTNCDHLTPPPPNPCSSETAFSPRFQKAYMEPPPPPPTKTERNFGTLDQKFRKPTALAQTEYPREICEVASRDMVGVQLEQREYQT